MEFMLGRMEFAESVKFKFIQNHTNEIEILFLGSSQVERAINPKFLTPVSINLANSSQRLYEDFELLKRFNKELPNLNVVLIEITFDKLERDRTETSILVHHKNLKPKT